MTTQYYDTDKLPWQFRGFRFLAIGTANWDYFIDRTCPVVYYVAKYPDCQSGYHGSIEDFLHLVRAQPRKHHIIDYLPPIPAAWYYCLNAPQKRDYTVRAPQYVCCAAHRAYNDAAHWRAQQQRMLDVLA